MSFYFQSLNEFFAMGGHGFYVWSCYFAVSILLISQTIFLVKGLKSTKQKIARYYQRLDSLSKE